jgi:predicted O-methyltransferase YrrM
MTHSPVNALSKRSRFYRRVATRLRIRRAHSAVIDHYLASLTADANRPGQPVFVEVGAGLTTGAIAGHATRLNAIFYTCDINEQLLGEIASNLAPGSPARPAPGDSLSVLPRIAAEIDRVDFAYLDSAPSALRTFREFQILEPLFRPGSVVILDNASLPGAWFTFSPCRKGRILVPYLLASPLWEVIPWPHDGDSMIAAIRHAEPRWSHPNYELSDHRGGDWRRRIPAKQHSPG